MTKLNPILVTELHFRKIIGSIGYQSNNNYSEYYQRADVDTWNIDTISSWCSHVTHKEEPQLKFKSLCALKWVFTWKSTKKNESAVFEFDQILWFLKDLIDGSNNLNLYQDVWSSHGWLDTESGRFVANNTNNTDYEVLDLLRTQ